MTFVRVAQSAPCADSPPIISNDYSPSVNATDWTYYDGVKILSVELEHDSVSYEVDLSSRF